MFEKVKQVFLWIFGIVVGFLSLVGVISLSIIKYQPGKFPILQDEKEEAKDEILDTDAHTVADTLPDDTKSRITAIKKRAVDRIRKLYHLDGD